MGVSQTTKMGNVEVPGLALVTHPLQCSGAGESVLRGDLESPPVPDGPFGCSLGSGSLLRAVAQAQSQPGTVVPQQVDQLPGAAVSLAAAGPCMGRGALVLLLQGKAQGSCWKGQSGTEASGAAFGLRARALGLAGLARAEAAASRAPAASAWCCPWG